MSPRLARLLLALIAVSLVMPASGLEPWPDPERRYVFTVEDAFGTTDLDEVVLWGTSDYAWVDLRDEHEVMRQAFLENVYVTGPDGARVAIEAAATRVDSYETPLEEPADRIVLSGLPEGWNTLWIPKRCLFQYGGETLPQLFLGRAPEGGWVETGTYYRLDFLMQRSDPGIARVAQSQGPSSGSEPATDVTVTWSEPVRFQQGELEGALTFFDDEGEALECPGTPALRGGATVYEGACLGVVASLELNTAPVGLDSGAEASFPSVGERVHLADWLEDDRERALSVRRGEVDVPGFEWPDPVLPARVEPPAGCSASAGGGAYAGAWLLVAGVWAFRRRR